MILAPAERPPTPACPACRARLTYVDTEASFDAFRTEAPSKPTPQVHHYDCEQCRTCWTLGEELEPDRILQISKGAGWTTVERSSLEPRGADPRESSRLLLTIGLCAAPSAVFMLSALVNAYAPRNIFSGRQWLFNGLSYVLAWSLGLAVLFSPFAILGTIWRYRSLTPRDQIIAIVFVVIAGGAPALVALFFFGISQIR